jgi:hypothetical protein
VWSGLLTAVLGELVCWGSWGWSIIGDVQVAAIAPMCAKDCCYGERLGDVEICATGGMDIAFENIVFYLFLC